MKLEFSKVLDWTKYFERAGSKDEDAKTIAQMHADARSYIEYFDWCGEILEEYVGFVYPGIVGVFLFKIQPTREDVDEWAWVITGDLPPAYITCEDSPNPAAALDSYIGAMEEWVEAASSGKSTNGLIPVDAEPTKDNAERLRARLEYLDEKILSGHQEDLKDSQ